MKDLVLRRSVLPANAAGDTYLRLPPGLTRNQWTDIASSIAVLGVKYSWWLADLSAYARHNFKDKETALKELANAVGVDSRYLNELGLVAQRFSVKDRIPSLSIQHHRLAMRLDKSKIQTMLKQAAEHGWSCKYMADKFTPIANRTFRIVMRLPIKHQDDSELHTVLKNITNKYDGKFWIQKYKKFQNRKTARAVIE
jgi:hypothetical protein